MNVFPYLTSEGFHRHHTTRLNHLHTVLPWLESGRMWSYIYQPTKVTIQCDLNSKGAIHILHKISNVKIRGIDHYQHFGVSSSPTFPMSEKSTVK